MTMIDATSSRNDHESWRRAPWRIQGAIRRRMMTKVIMAVAFTVLSCLGLTQTGSPQGKSEPVRLTKEGQEWVEETLRGLSLEEKVGQMLQVRSYADYPSFEAADYKWLQERLQKDHVGSVILAAHINTQGLVRVDALAAAKTIETW